MNCCRHLSTVLLPNHTTQIDYGTILVDKSMKVSLYNKCDNWSLGCILVCGIIHNSCTEEKKRNLLSMPSYANAKNLNKSRSMWLALVGALSLNGGTAGDENSKLLQSARHVRNMVNILQNKYEACAAYIERYDSDVNNLHSLNVDMTVGLGPSLLIGSILWHTLQVS